MIKKQQEEKRTILYLQDRILKNIPFEKLPAKWQGFNFARFSKDKTLFDFQQNAIKNALRGLWLYFKDKKGDKEEFFKYYWNGFEEDLDYNLNYERKAIKYLLEYPKDYPVIDNKISFANFINRMSFWMATGSGKTLIIVKLIELLGKLIIEKELPNWDILFLTHRDDLLDQFKNHIEEFNSFNFDTKINLRNLRDYESVKRENALPFVKNEITVFYYRSDLISDEQKEKIVNFKNYDNEGKWYILLDEAHKWDKEDSKKQILYSILSRNWFLFNFSATFTDPQDFVTCAFNFNLSKFIEEGYGKHIYISSSEIDAFKNKKDFSESKKQKIVLKTLIVFTYISKYFEKIRKHEKNLYHRPLLLSLVNSVNKSDSDLKLFFKEIEKIASEKPKKLEKAKKEIIQEFSKYKKYLFENNSNFIFDKKELEKINYEDILKYLYNSENPGVIEIIFRSSDKSQVAFKLDSSDKYFALIKTGDMPQWLRNELLRFKINQRFETEGIFQTINQKDSEINILMGSRSFYEWWDSNRPNLILFINIGVWNNAKKFVLQSIGRWIRLEPIKNKRKRFLNLLNSKEIKEEDYKQIKDLIMPIESLFVFGTNAENLKEIIATLKTEEQNKNLEKEFKINSEEQNLLYKNSEKKSIKEKNNQKYSINREDFNIASKFYNFIWDKIALVKYNCEVKTLKNVKESFLQKEQYYEFNKEESILEPELILEGIFNYFKVKNNELR